MSYSRKFTYTALAATLTLLLGACGQTEVAASNSPAPALTAVRSTGTAPIPFDTFGRTPAGSRQTFQAQAAAQDIARIQVFPPTASLADGGTATFYAEAFDASGNSLGNIDYADLTVSQVTPQTGAVIEAGITSTGFRVTVPTGQYDNRTLVVALKDQPTVRSQIDLATVALQPGVINLSDGNIQFPKVTTDYSQATEAQVAAELAPFTLSEYIGAFPAQANQLNSPFILQSSVPLRVGDLIHISHSGSTFGRIATMQVKGNLYLVSLELAPVSSVIKDFSKYLDTTTTSEGARPQSTTLSAQQTGSPGSCSTQSPLINLGKIEIEQIDLDKKKLVAKYSAGFNLDLNVEIAAAECVLESTPVYTRINPYISLGFSMRNYAKLAVEGTVDGKFGSRTTLSGNIFDPPTLSADQIVEGAVNLLGGGIDGIAASSKGTAELGIFGRLHIVPADVWLQQKAAQILKFFGGNQNGNYNLIELYIDLGIPLSLEGDFLTSRAAFDRDDGSKVSAKVSLKAETGLQGAMIDVINAWALNLPTLSGEWKLAEEESKRPEVKEVIVTDKNGSADIVTVWGDSKGQDQSSFVHKTVLGDLSHDTGNSLHRQEPGITFGSVNYDLRQCTVNRLQGKILGYGTLLWKDKPMPFFGSLPFSTKAIVQVCSRPAIKVPDSIDIFGSVGQYAKGNIKIENIGDVGSVLEVNLSSNDPIDISPNYGRIMGIEYLDTELSYKCNEVGSYKYAVKIVSSSGENKYLNVNVRCSNLSMPNYPVGNIRVKSSTTGGGNDGSCIFIVKYELEVFIPGNMTLEGPRSDGQMRSYISPDDFTLDLSGGTGCVQNGIREGVNFIESRGTIVRDFLKSHLKPEFDIQNVRVSKESLNYSYGLFLGDYW